MDKLCTQKLLLEAKDLIENDECKQALKLLEPMLALRVPEALFLYSTFSLAATETDREFDQRRIQLLQEASDAGYPPAIYELAVCYEIGDIVEEDEVMASALYKQAAECGYSKAKLSHGLNLYYGSNGINQDKVLGFCMVRQAVDEGVDEAEAILQQLQRP